MADSSAYLRFLPPAVWSAGDRTGPHGAHREHAGGTSGDLNALLRIFEKVLSGIDDEHRIAHGDHTHESIQTVIERMHELFDPWRTGLPHAPEGDPRNGEFLAWLASWLALEFPARGGRLAWDEYQRRKITAEISRIYQNRGLKQGLNQYLTLYTQSAKRPRIAIDDGSCILFTRPRSGRLTPIAAYVSSRPAAYDDDHRLILHEPGLVRPLSIAARADGSLIVGDLGTPSVWQTPPPTGGERARIAPGLWVLPALTAGGEAPLAAPQRIPLPAGLSLEEPIGLAVAETPRPVVYILDRALSSASGGTRLHRLSLATHQEEGSFTHVPFDYPVGMALAPDGRLLVLDRGVDVEVSMRAAARLWEVDVTADPAGATSHDISDLVVEPLSLLVLPDGSIVVGDGLAQNRPGPANLVHLARTNEGRWTGRRLLDPTANPLITPVALAPGDAGQLFVLDPGLRPQMLVLDPALGSSSFRRREAEAAAVYRVELDAAGETGFSSVTPVAAPGQLVSPTDMINLDGVLLITDQGAYSTPGLGALLPRVWRMAPHEFGVMVHFSEERPTTPLERSQIIDTIRDIIDREKPAHTDWTLVYPFEDIGGGA